MKSHDFWLLFDDDIVEVSGFIGVNKFTIHYLCFSQCTFVTLQYDIFLSLQKIDAQAIEEFYGLTSEISKNSESGYILFYQSRD